MWLVICGTQLRMRGIILRENPEKLTEPDAREQVTMSMLAEVVVVGIALIRERVGRTPEDQAQERDPDQDQDPEPAGR